jgi:hypothetical protein
VTTSREEEEERLLALHKLMEEFEEAAVQQVKVEEFLLE